MRVLADACQDPGLTSLFASTEGGNKGDIYRRLAAQVRSVLVIRKVYPRFCGCRAMIPVEGWA